MIPTMPDVDRLLTDAVREGLPEARVCVLMPPDWLESLPIVLIRQVPGGSSDFRGVATVTVDVQAIAGTRRDASALARNARAALVAACAAGFSNGEGYLGAFRDVSGLPVEIRGGQPGDDPHQHFRFQGTYQVVVRPVRRRRNS